MAGNYSRVPETVCNPKDPGRKKFTMQTDAGTLTLTVPSYVEEKQVRYLVDQGKNLIDAYKYANIWAIIPEKGMRPCVYDALRVKYFDPDSGERRLTGGNFTCIAYHHCFEDALRAFREYPEKRGRITIAPGVISPSPDEQTCIKRSFAVSKNLPKAYSDCGASDILPTWEGAVPAISKTLTDYPAADLYHVIKTLYFLHTQTPEDRVDQPTAHEPAKPNWKLYIVIAAIVAIVLMPRQTEF